MLLFLISSLFVLSNGVPVLSNRDGVPLQLQPLKSLNATNLIAGISTKNLIAKLADGGSEKNLIAELADADPAKVEELITLVEAMIGVAQNDLDALTVTSTDANAAYITAVSTYDAAVVAQTQVVTDAQTAVTNAQTAVTDALTAKTFAQGAKTGAQSSLDADKSRLDAELVSLQQVVTILRGLSASPSSGVCPDFSFDGSELTSEKCPKGWTCSSPYKANGGRCGPYDGVFVGEYSRVIASCNGCMIPSGNDGFFFKISWDNQCGNAQSDTFSLPVAVVKATFLIGGGADKGGFWVHRASDDSVMCSFVGPPTCPMVLKECVLPAASGGTRVYIKLEKPCSGSGGWENLVLDDIRFKDANGQDLTTC